MTEEQQRIAIAEACGKQTIFWRASWCRGFEAHSVDGAKSREELSWLDGRDDLSIERYLDLDLTPDYTGDLNAMHEAEKILDGLDDWIGEEHHANAREAYMSHLQDVISRRYRDDWSFLTATAAQRAEAFLRTIGKWESPSSLITPH